MLRQSQAFFSAELEAKGRRVVAGAGWVVRKRRRGRRRGRGRRMLWVCCVGPAGEAHSAVGGAEDQKRECWWWREPWDWPHLKSV